MSKNKTADTLQAIGILIALLGVVGSLILGKICENQIEKMLLDKASYNWTVALIGIVYSVISGVLFYGFGEVISLLQEGVDTQKQVIDLLSDKASPEQNRQNAQPIPVNSVTTPTLTETCNTEKNEPVSPVGLNANEIFCPVCGQKQPSKRHLCFKCGTPF